MRSARIFCIAYSLALRDHLLKLLDRGIAVHNFDELTVVHDFVLYEIFRNEVHLFSVLAEDPFGALILLGDDPLDLFVDESGGLL